VADVLRKPYDLSTEKRLI